MRKVIMLLTICMGMIACKSKPTQNRSDSSVTVSDSANKNKPESDKKIEDSVATPAPASGMGDKVPNSTKNGN